MSNEMLMGNVKTKLGKSQIIDFINNSKIKQVDTCHSTWPHGSPKWMIGWGGASVND